MQSREQQQQGNKSGEEYLQMACKVPTPFSYLLLLIFNFLLFIGTHPSM